MFALRQYRCLRKFALPKVVRRLSFENKVPPSTSTYSSDSISQILEQSSWSVRSLLPSSSGTNAPQIASKQLHHLLRLSALPLPSSAEDEADMLRTLESQLHFVNEIQQINTIDVTPLRAIRDETATGKNEQTVRLSSLKDALAREDVVGKHYKRIWRIRSTSDLKDSAEDWNPLGNAEREARGYFIVENEKA